VYYAEAFHDAGQVLVRQLRIAWKFGANFTPAGAMKAVPVVCLYWHTLELYLKSIILDGRDILPLHGKAPMELRTEHTLEALTNDVDKIFKEFGWSWNFGAPYFRTRTEFLSIAAELHRFNRSNEIRYPTRKDGTPVLRENFRFNLFHFCERLDSVLEALGLMAFGVEAELQQRQEMRAAVQP
jgi:hypothetical protein